MEKLENQNYFGGRESAQNNERSPVFKRLSPEKRGNGILKRKCDTPPHNFTEQRPIINDS